MFVVIKVNDFKPNCKCEIALSLVVEEVLRLKKWIQTFFNGIFTSRNFRKFFRPKFHARSNCIIDSCRLIQKFCSYLSRRNEIVRFF